MKQIDFNEFKKMGIELIIDDKHYIIQFIPYPIESEMYKKSKEISELFSDISKISDEWEERLKYWLWGTISHKKNDNKIEMPEKEFYENIGLTEVIIAITSLQMFITTRMINMNSLFSDEKKTIENLTKEAESKLPTGS